MAKDGPLGKGHTVKKEKQEERNRFYLLVKCVPVKWDFTFLKLLREYEENKVCLSEALMRKEPVRLWVKIAWVEIAGEPDWLSAHTVINMLALLMFTFFFCPGWQFWYLYLVLLVPKWYIRHPLGVSILCQQQSLFMFQVSFGCLVLSDFDHSDMWFQEI